MLTTKVLVFFVVCLAVSNASIVLKHPRPAGRRCITSCVGLDDGDYQSCKRCEVYASCVAGQIIDDRPCAPGHDPPLVWDDNNKTCEYQSTTCPDNIVYPVCWDENGKKFSVGPVPSKDPCKICKCLSYGQIKCHDVTCPPLLCPYPIPKPGECCQVCPEYDCTDAKGNTYNAGDLVPCTDPCRECTCHYNGSIVCEEKQCPPTPCANPVREPGECCGTCPGCHYNNTYYKPHDVVPGYEKCKKCVCKYGKIECEKEYCPEVYCPDWKIPDKHCCPICTGCYHDNIYYKPHAVVPGYEKCKKCVCKYGKIECEKEYCPKVYCPDWKIPDKHCCPICTGCYHDNIYYKPNTVVPGYEKCKKCVCKYGKIECEKEYCPKVHCPDWRIPDDHCCPKCPGCTQDGIYYKLGDSVPCTDPCQRCTCKKGGKIDCYYIKCPKRPCIPWKVIKPGQCCPVCRACWDPKQVGSCSYHKVRYFFNKVTGKCERFYYRGCGGNANNFETLRECEQSCY